MSSYWIDSTKEFDKSELLDKDYSADVCIIGAGISGLSTGYYLAKNGLNVIILDKYNIGQKTSGNTTAKITFQHHLIYDYLINSYGEKYAKGYLESNKKAISNIKKIIDSENIDCDFEYQPNYIYTINDEDITKIQKELKALNALEENCEFVTNCDLPFKIKGGIKIENQAQFHPRKYMYGLVNAIKNYGGKIFTESVVKDVKKEGEYHISYTNNYKIKSKYVVIATHYPFINFPGIYFLKMYQVTSYVIGIETDKRLFNGMYINSSEPTISYRTAKYGDKKILIIAGGNHKTGYSPESEELYGYKVLEKEMEKYYKDAKILYKWNTRDCVTLDKIPYIGMFSNLMPNMYVVTGFNKWGMTSSNVAANIISDYILGNKNEYADIYNSTRLKPLKNKEELKNMVKQVYKSFVSNKIKVPEEDLSTIKTENGGILKINGKMVGIYKDQNDVIYAVNPTCTHLGCLLTWNNIDKTWDCPCHGSRYDYKGKNIYEPAFKDLNRFDII